MHGLNLSKGFGNTGRVACLGNGLFMKHREVFDQFLQFGVALNRGTHLGLIIALALGAHGFFQYGRCLVGEFDGTRGQGIG